MATQVKINTIGMAKWTQAQEKALQLAGDIFTARVTKEVPIDTGQLRRSAYAYGRRVKTPEDTPTHIYVSWNTDYAAKCYFGEDITFREPGTHAYWGLDLINNTSEMNRILAGCLALYKI